jgi:hypothetical protein
MLPNRRHLTISANTLFHYTHSKENLLSILQNDFYPRYALENMNIVEPEIPERHIAIPMVSFCDIPLSQVKDHSENYGGYALGLTKDWAKHHGISPVLYAHPNALNTGALATVLNNLASLAESKQFSKLVKTQRDLMYFSFFIKRYEGFVYRDGAYQNNNVRFYDEREWRFIPPIHFFLDETIQPFLTKEMYDNITIRDDENDKIAYRGRLSFQPKYIKYVIVQSETERLEMMDSLQRIKEPKFPIDEVRKLTTRIISMEQILDDF